ncbi:MULTISPECIES: C40 family peptidase [Alteribacter]|uniref:NlpC/P60 family protein n=1 Tax=Alteribacter keqinensis TaxID=2483800 RepID=A0A3M7TUB7_9BACI|nr:MULTISPECIES: C40 family peptidase [Alteribacter]MBM7097482.1 C40 family peptidase [Alteribacter salitolerans]RNA68582.1 NlpC/P60 family protein [Alteribacter keqinensis]
MLINNIIATGFKHMDKPYLFNARPFQTETFDCSSFIQYIFFVHGISLPRCSRQQYLFGTRVRQDDIRRGDLLFFTTKKRKRLTGLQKIGHVAIYLGNGKMLHTFRPVRRVSVSKLDSKWEKKYQGARRIID